MKQLIINKEIMFRKIFAICIVFFLGITNSIAAAPEVNCVWLPGCSGSDRSSPSTPDISSNVWMELISSIIWQLIQFVAVIAVIALIISGIMYLVSWWAEEKVKKAKTWITWSLIWVLLSVSAWGIINMLNNIKIA